MIECRTETEFNEITNKDSDAKLFHGEIDDDTNNNFISVFNKYLKNTVKNDSSSEQITFDSFDLIDNDLKTITNEAFYYLTLKGFDINKDKGMIEFWKYNTDGKKINSKLAFHVDDYGALNCSVETCIFYLQKDLSIVGGNLFYDPPKKTKFNIPKLFSNYKELEIREKMIVLMSGNLLHRPQSVSGKGSRSCVVVQFESLSRE